MNVKNKIACLADKVSNSKVYKACEKAAITAGAGIITAGTMAMTSFASEVGSIAISEINSQDVINNAMKFVNIGLPIFAVVGGIRLGFRFLRGCMH